MNWIRILIHSTWIIQPGVRHCRIKDLPVIYSNQKNNASTNTNFSFRCWVLANNFFLQVLWKRTNRNDSRISSVFIYLFIDIFLFWRDWTRILVESQSSMKHTFMQIIISLGSFHILWYLYVMIVKTFHELE